MIGLLSIRESSRYLILLSAILLVNLISSQFHLRWDITQDKVYSVSEGSERLLQKVDSKFHVKFFFSRSRKQLPTLVKTYGMRIEEVLHAFAGKSQGKMTVEVIDPQPDTENEDWARRFGLIAAQLPDGENVFFGMVFLRGGNEVGNLSSAVGRLKHFTMQ